MRRKTHEEFARELAIKNPLIGLRGTYVNCSTKIEVQCLKCHYTWNTTPNSLSNGHGCPRCANNQKKTQDRFVEEMRNFNLDIEIVGTYKRAHDPIEIRCRLCGNTWLCSPNRLFNGAVCQRCKKQSRTGLMK